MNNLFAGIGIVCLAIVAISGCITYSPNFTQVSLPPSENGYLIYPSKLENCQLRRWYGGYRVEKRSESCGVTETLVPIGTEPAVEVPVFMGFISSVKVGKFNFISEEEALFEVQPLKEGPVRVELWVNGTTVRVKTKFSCRPGERYFIVLAPTRDGQVQLAPQLQRLQEWVEITMSPAKRQKLTLGAIKAAK